MQQAWFWFCKFLVALLVTIIVGMNPDDVGYKVEQVTPPGRSSHTEGPHWDDDYQVLYFVSISDGKAYTFDPKDNALYNIKLDKALSLIVPVRDEQYKFIITQDNSLALLYWNWLTGEKKVCTLASVEDGKNGNRFNDGKADARGRLWAGTMGPESDGEELAVPGQGGLYRLDYGKDGWTASQQVDKADISNGMTWNSDNTKFYWVDMPGRTVFRFDYNIEHGSIKNRKLAYKMDPKDGHPDGLTIDKDDNLWVAGFNRSQVLQVDPTTGEVMRRVKIPAARVSSMAWGGRARDELYVTTMSHGCSQQERDQQPLAGAVFKVTGLGTSGRPMNKVYVPKDFVC